MTEQLNKPLSFVGPDWFWDVLESAKPNLQRLVDWLETATREEIVAFERTYEDAAKEVCDYWSGPTVDGVGFSEDDTEDFCHWVVSQGRALWRQARTAPDLEPFVRLYWAAEDGATDWPKWNSSVLNENYRGYQAPGSVAYAVFEARFSEPLDQYLAEDT